MRGAKAIFCLYLLAVLAVFGLGVWVTKKLTEEGLGIW